MDSDRINTKLLDGEKGMMTDTRGFFSSLNQHGFSKAIVSFLQNIVPVDRMHTINNQILHILHRKLD